MHNKVGLSNQNDHAEEMSLQLIIQVWKAGCFGKWNLKLFAAVNVAVFNTLKSLRVSITDQKPCFIDKHFIIYKLQN